MAKLVVGLDEGDDDAIITAFKGMGFKITGMMDGNEGLADRMLLISAYGDFDQQYGTKVSLARVKPRPISGSPPLTADARLLPRCGSSST